MTIADTLHDAVADIRDNYLTHDDVLEYGENELYPEILRVTEEMDALRKKLDSQGPEPS
jgi:hypothetical protein